MIGCTTAQFTGLGNKFSEFEFAIATNRNNTTIASAIESHILHYIYFISAIFIQLLTLSEDPYHSIWKTTTFNDFHIKGVVALQPLQQNIKDLPPIHQSLNHCTATKTFCVPLPAPTHHFCNLLVVSVKKMPNCCYCCAKTNSLCVSTIATVVAPS